MDLSDESVDLDKIIKEGTELTSKIKENEEIIAIVGSTGSGKSTLLKFLLKDEALCIRENEQHEYFYDESNASNGIIGTDSFNSKTILPNVFHDVKSGCKIVDCAGFDDTRSSETDFVASIFNKEILDGTRRLKIVIVEDNDKLKLQSDRGSFMRVMHHLSNLLKFNYKSFESSICLVANKIDSTKTDDILMESAAIFMKKMKEHVTAKMDEEDLEDSSVLRMRKLLDFLIKRKRIGIFRKPNKIEDPWMSESTENNWLALRKLIFDDLQYTTKISGEFNITVAPDTLIWLNNSLYEKTLEELKLSIDSIIKSIDDNIRMKLEGANDGIKSKIRADIEIKEKILSELSSINNEQDIIAMCCGGPPDVIERFQFLVQKLKFIFKVLGKSEEMLLAIVTRLNGYRGNLTKKLELSVKYSKFIHTLSAAATTYEVRIHNEELLKLLREVDTENFKLKMTSLAKFGFSADMANQAQEQQIMWPSRIEDLKDYISEKNDSKFYTEWVDDGILLVKGRHLILSKLLTLFAQKQLVKQVVLAASQIIYIDCDLTLTHTHLVLIAPYVEIVNRKRVITLKGEDGKSLEAKQASPSMDDSPGEKGFDGNPGYSSGSIHVVSLDVRNPKYFSIQTEGGNGSDGQQGGDGRSVTECHFPQFEKEDIKGGCTFFRIEDFLSQFRVEFNLHDIKIIEERDFDITRDLFRETPKKIFTVRIDKHPDNDLRPTTGGQGGTAGALAIAGDVGLVICNSVAIPQIEVSRRDGKNGEPGQGGRGGIRKGKYKILECLFKTNLFKWTVKILKDLETGDCGCTINEAKNGEMGRYVFEDKNLRYKYSNELLPYEKIKEVILHDFNEGDYADDLDFKQFMQFLNDNHALCNFHGHGVQNSLKQ